MQTPQKITERPYTHRDTWNELGFGLVVVAVCSVLAVALSPGWVAGYVIGVPPILDALVRAARMSARKRSGGPPMMRSYTHDRTDVAVFVGRVGYDGPLGALASLPVVKIDGVSVGPEGYGWDVTAPGAGSSNRAGSWPWAEIEAAALVTEGSRPQVHVRRAGETVVFQGRPDQVTALTMLLRDRLGDRWIG